MNCTSCAAAISNTATFCESCGAKVAAAAPQDNFLGRTLLNQYVVRKKLGEGGFGAVYEAEQPSMGRKVAIKTLHRHLTHNAQIVARFHREGMAASRLEHPYAVRMLNSGETDDGLLWLAMEFLSGETLDARIKQQGALTPKELNLFMGPVCEVLAEAHEKGIVHRDLKPENIMLVPGPGGKIIPKLLDFGIAGLVDDSGQATKTGLVSGTPAYMSPEQWRGLKHTDARSDIYSMGLILYQCLCARLPFEADSTPEWMQKHCLEEPRVLIEMAKPGEITPALNAVVMKALSKDPAKRYQSALELKEALEEAVSAQKTAASAETMLATTPIAPAVVKAPEPPAQRAEEQNNEPVAALRPAPKRGPLYAAALLVPAVAVGAYLFFAGPAPEAKQSAAPPKTQASEATTTAATESTSASTLAATTTKPALQVGTQPSQPTATTQQTTSQPATEQAVVVPATPGKIKLSITTTPPGAAVSIGGKNKGTTTKATEIELDFNEKKAVKLTLKLEGYEPKTVSVTPNKAEIAISEKLTKIPTPADCTDVSEGGGRFKKCPDGSTYDSTLKIFWGNEASSDATFDKAKISIGSYKGGGWRMPTVKELLSLHNTKVTTYQSGSLVKLTDYFVWAKSDSEAALGGSTLYYDCLTKSECPEVSWAFYVSFLSGVVNRYNRSYYAGTRALPVRRGGD